MCDKKHGHDHGANTYGAKQQGTKQQVAKRQGDEHKSCREYSRLSRRRFLGLSGGLMATALVPGWLPRVALADSQDSDRDVLVSIFLRGGCDALSFCVPYFEPNYYRLRPNLAIAPPDSSDPNRVVDLDGRFGLSPSLSPLLNPYRDGSLAIVHACGFDHPTRSHFEAMNFMEIGQADPPANFFNGWLARHLQITPPMRRDALLRAVGLTDGLPQTLFGAPNALPIPDPANFGFGGRPQTESERREALHAMYQQADSLLASSAQNTLATVDLLETIDFEAYEPSGGAAYPEGEFGYALQSSAALIKSEIGVEALAIDLGGWDTHEFQGPIDGDMAQLMGDFASSLDAFYQDLWASDFTRLTVVVMTEFGRNVFENGSLGTDHGHGSLMMVLGGAVQGGQVITEWPGLENELLYDGQDLEITIDYRDILSEILTKRLANANPKAVFDDPSFQPIDRGLVV